MPEPLDECLLVLELEEDPDFGILSGKNFAVRVGRSGFLIVFSIFGRRADEVGGGSGGLPALMNAAFIEDGWDR